MSLFSILRKLVPMTTYKTYAAVVVVDNEKVFVLRRKKHPRFGTFEFPAGKGEPGERPVFTAMREFYEETGCRIDSPSQLQEFAVTTTPDQNGGDAVWKNYYYMVSKTALAAEPVVGEPHVHDAYGWFYLSSLENMPLINMTKMILPVVKSIFDASRPSP